MAASGTRVTLNEVKGAFLDAWPLRRACPERQRRAQGDSDSHQGADPMHVFLTGTTGHIGAGVADKLQATGHDVGGLAGSGR